MLLRVIRGATGPTPMTHRRACRARRADGAQEKTCRGNRCGSSASAKSNTTTCKVIAFGMLQFFLGGGQTNRRENVDTISSTSRHLSSSRRSSARLALSADVGLTLGLVVRVQRLLLGANALRDMLQIDADTRPG